MLFFSPQKQSGNYVMKVLAGGNHFAIYTCIKSTQCIPETYTVFYVHCISVKLENFF